MAPTKALCNEIHLSWRKKFASYNVSVALVTGDADLEDIADLGDLEPHQIVVTTPEKWDAMTRKWKEYREIANMIKLILIDEIHLVGDEWRGPTLEAIVSRFKSMQQNETVNRIRFVAVSASLPNVEDITNWISFNESSDSIRAFRFVYETQFVSICKEIEDFSILVSKRVNDRFS